jgi:lipopolysaccharide exporter
MSERIKKNLKLMLVGESLKARVFRGGAWLGAGSFSEQVTRFVRNMILTRLLAPEAFGTMAVVLSACSVVQTIMDVGAKEALIQNPRGSEDEYVGAAWWMAFGRAATFWAVVSLIAPFIAKFYGNPALSSLFRVAAIGVLFDGAISARAYVAIREMKFRKWAITNHGGAILGVLTTLALSFLLKNVWALVLGYCAESVGRFVMSFLLCPFLPPRKLPLAAIRDLLKFSKKAFGLSMLNLIFARTDIFVLAKMFSPAELGLYTMAIYLVQTPASFVMNLLGQTLLPTFSQVQEDNERANRILLQVTSVLFLVGMPAFAFVFFCGGPLLTIIYGHRYGAAAASLVVASLVALLNLANGQLTSVMFGKGKPDLHRRCVVIMAIVMMILIYPCVHYFGVVGGQLAALAAIIAGLLFQMVRVRHLTGLALGEYSRIFLTSALISLSVVFVCIGARVLSLAAKPLPNILAGVLGCIIAYGLGAGFFLRGGSVQRAGNLTGVGVASD